MRPLKESDRRAGLPSLVAEIQMVSARIVKINGLLDEPLPQYPGVEIHRALGIVADKRDVV
jgi:hypothetical protein